MYDHVDVGNVLRVECQIWLWLWTARQYDVCKLKWLHTNNGRLLDQEYSLLRNNGILDRCTNNAWPLFKTAMDSNLVFPRRLVFPPFSANLLVSKPYNGLQ